MLFRSVKYKRKVNISKEKLHVLLRCTILKLHNFQENWGWSSAQQDGRFWFRFQVGSVEIFNLYPSPSAFSRPGNSSASNRNENQGIPLTVKRDRRGELKTLPSWLCRILNQVWKTNILLPSESPWLVAGKLYLFTVLPSRDTLLWPKHVRANTMQLNTLTGVNFVGISIIRNFLMHGSGTYKKFVWCVCVCK